MYCKDCKFYYTDLVGSTECTRIDSQGASSPTVKEGEATIYGQSDDDSGLDYGLKISPTFGCVLFQPKEKK